ncbi:MAG TPA: DUF1592 domain-containing protein, partial [Polyangiaceae bacterium]|nr:DUF1592 domain-containing protein [Polyangiaceae bacterium]
TLHELLDGQALSAPEPDTAPPWDAVVGDYNAWFVAADVAADAVFHGPGASACATGDCAAAFIDSFGLKAFRRPLRDEEKQAFNALYTKLSGQGSSPPAALQQVVRAMLASAQFIFHLEPTEQPDAAASTPLDSYALASRLSYSLWSAPPDDALFALAAQDALQTDEALLAQLKRLEADPRASAVGAGLADTWLGTGGLAQRKFDVSFFPSWTPSLGTAMSGEVGLYLGWFLKPGTPLNQLLTLDKNFVESSLARLYGLNPADFDASRPTDTFNPLDQRRGLLGLAGFLSASSLADRASPSRRGAAVLERVLCAPPPTHPASLAEPSLQTGAGSLRQRLETATVDPACAGCHQTFDPYGLALGDFDGIGNYVPGVPAAANTKVTLPSGESVNGLLELSDALSKDDRFFTCIPTRIAEYVVGRQMSDADTELITQLSTGMRNQHTLQDTLEQLTLSHAFRYRGYDP